MKIVLYCALGMSTSLLVESMREEAKKQGDAIEINAYSVDEFDLHSESADVILLGPQIRFKKKSLEIKADAIGKPLEIIDPVSYGTINGQKVLEQARGMLNKK